jgi:acetyl esterase/lipase
MTNFRATPRRFLPAVALAATIFTCLPVRSAEQDAKLKATPDLVFAEVDGAKLMLNLYLPAKAEKPPLVVYIHGGGWRAGDRKDKFPLWIAEHGFAVASIDYRLSTVAPFPAQIFDCKAAIRWLRAHANEYGYNAQRVAATGTSAGGHLALLLGTSGDEKELEGDVGGNLTQSSRVQAVVDFYGPSDFVLRTKAQPEQTDKPGGKVYQLLGKPVQENLELAKLASPAFHVTKDDPPLLIFHGSADKTVLMNQAERIRDAYQAVGLPVEFHVLEGAAHGGAKFSAPECQEPTLKFLEQHLNAAK